MIIHSTTIPDVLLLEPKVFGDERGFFKETFRDTTFAAAGLPTVFVQEGGYRTRTLGTNARRFFTGFFEGGHTGQKIKTQPKATSETKTKAKTKAKTKTGVKARPAANSKTKAGNRK